MCGLLHHAVVVLNKLQVIILARESGLKLELSDIQIVNLVPEPLRVSHEHKFIINHQGKRINANALYFQAISSTEEFMNELPKFDDNLSKQRDDAEVSGEVSFLMVFHISLFLGFNHSVVTIFDILDTINGYSPLKDVSYTTIVHWEKFIN